MGVLLDDCVVLFVRAVANGISLSQKCAKASNMLSISSSFGDFNSRAVVVLHSFMHEAAGDGVQAEDGPRALSALAGLG